MNTSDPSSARFELFARTRERIGSALVVGLRLQMHQIIDDIDDAWREPGATGEASRLRDFAALLRAESARRIEQLPGWLNDRTLNSLELGAQLDLSADGELAWRLLAKDEHDAQIVVARLAAAVREAAADIYPAYSARIARLTERHWPLDEILPLGATAAAAVACRLFDGLADDPRVLSRLHDSLYARLPAALAAILRDADVFLADHGIDPLPAPALEAPPPQGPGPRSAAAAQGASIAAAPAATTGPSVVAPSDSAPASGAPDPTREPAASRVQDTPSNGTGPAAADAPRPVDPVDAAVASSSGSASTTAASAAGAGAGHGPDSPDAVRAADEFDALERGVKALQRDIASASKLGSSPVAAKPPNRLRVVPSLESADDAERDAVAFAHALDVVPYSRDSRHAYFQRLRRRLGESAATPAQLAQVEIVSAMFDYVIDDRRLPDAARPLVWRLQRPVLALSLLDPGYLSDDPRSLRRLVENVGVIATNYSDDMVKDGELFRRLETVVRAIEIIASGLQVSSAVIARQVDREYRRASHGVSKLVNRVVNERTTLEAMPGRRNRRDMRKRPGRDRERQVTEQVRALLSERLEHAGVPESVGEFLLSVWSRHLRTTVLRDGEHSEEFRKALAVVDELLWTLDETGERVSRTELVNRIPHLIALLNLGIRDVDAKDAEYKAFFDELFLIHLRRMQPRSGHRKSRRSPNSRNGPRSVSKPGPAAGAGVAVPSPSSRLGGPSVPVLDDQVALPPGATPAGATAGADPVPPAAAAVGSDAPIDALADEAVLADPSAVPRLDPVDALFDIPADPPGTSSASQSAAQADPLQSGQGDAEVPSVTDAACQTPAEAMPQRADAGSSVEEPGPVAHPAQPIVSPAGVPPARPAPLSAPGHQTLDLPMQPDSIQLRDIDFRPSEVAARFGPIPDPAIDFSDSRSLSSAVERQAPGSSGITIGGFQDSVDPAGPAAAGPQTGGYKDSNGNGHAGAAGTHGSTAARPPAYEDDNDGTTFGDIASVSGPSLSGPGLPGFTPSASTPSARLSSGSLSPAAEGPGRQGRNGSRDAKPATPGAPFVIRPVVDSRGRPDDDVPSVPFEPESGMHEPPSTEAGRRADALVSRIGPLSRSPVNTGIPDQRLVEVLNSIDLSDAPEPARRLEMKAGDAVATLERGSWIEITAADGSISDAKVAWINPRRTVVLLVRRSDRKALSLRMTELRVRFERGRAHLLRM